MSLLGSDGRCLDRIDDPIELEEAEHDEFTTQRDLARRAAERTLERMARGTPSARVVSGLSAKTWTPKDAPIRALTWRGDVLFVQHISEAGGAGTLLVSASVAAGLRVVVSRYRGSLVKMIEDLS